MEVRISESIPRATLSVSYYVVRVRLLSLPKSMIGNKQCSVFNASILGVEKQMQVSFNNILCFWWALILLLSGLVGWRHAWLLVLLRLTVRFAPDVERFHVWALLIDRERCATLWVGKSKTIEVNKIKLVCLSLVIQIPSMLLDQLIAILAHSPAMRAAGVS